MAQQTIEFNQGDDYLLRLNNFNPEHKYKVYIQFFDEDGAFVGNQLSYDVNYTDSVDVLLPAAFTDNLTVPLGEDYQLYYLGGKQAEVVENKITLYAFDNEDTTLYTHNLNIAVDDVLYDSDNEATEYEVGSINSIVNDSGTFERDSANNLLEYETDYYAWSISDEMFPELTECYTQERQPQSNSNVYDSEGNVINIGYGNATVYYSDSEHPDDLIILLPIENDGKYIQAHRDSQNDIKTLIGIIAYCWSLSGEHIYTLAENPAVGDMTYTYDEELIEGDEITAINSFMVSTDEYVRNANNDIEIIISTAYTGEKTIISELANKRPVIVYKKRAEGPV